MPQYQGVWSLQSAAQLQSTQRWVTDPLFDYTTLLLQADPDVTAAQNNTFIDSSSNGFPITRNGNTTQGTFTPFSSQPGAWSSFYSGASDNNGTYFAANSAYSFGTGDFTVEAWINIPPVSNSNGKVIVDSRPTATNGPYWIFAITNTGRLDGTTMTSGGVQLLSPNSLPTNEWVHVAYTRASGTLNLWVNGASVASATGNTNNISSDTLWIGRNAFSSSAPDTWFSGYMSNLRIVKGVAVYTGTFTPPTSPLQKTQPAGTNIAAITGSQTSLLFNQSNRFVDNSNLNATPLTLNTWPVIQTFAPFAPQFQWTPSVIGGSGYFDGAGDNLAVPASSANSVGSGSFYFEAWVYITNPSASQMIIADPSNTGGLFVGLNIDAGSRFAIGRTAVAVDNFVTVTWISNQWYHLAVNRNGTSLQFFVNGTQVGSTGTNSVNYPNVGYRIGAEQAGGSAAFTGYISGLRLVKSSVNTTNFTPPTAPPDASSSALCLQFTNAGVYDGTMKNNLETVGNAQISTAVVKYGSGSLYFDGSGDNLISPFSPNFQFGTGDFTVEFWINASASGVFNQVVGTQVSGTEAGTWRVGNRYNSTNSMYFARGNGSSFDEAVYGGVNVNDGLWHHVACVRLAGVIYMYVDGVARTVTSGSASIAGTCSSSNAFYVGYNIRDASYLTGYLDDVRITKGIARYTQNFIPPSVALPRQ